MYHEDPRIAQVILDSVSDGVFTVDREWCINSFNKAAELITGVPHDEAIGKNCYDVFQASICENECALRETLESGRPVVNKAIFIIDAHGEQLPISISTAILKDHNGKIVGGVETFRDLSLVEELRRKIEDRYRFGDIIGRSPSMRSLFDLIPVVAASDSTVLIHGASGTGKELVAHAIHDLSPRQKQRFVAINCGDCPGLLMPRVTMVMGMLDGLDQTPDAIHLGTCVKMAMEHGECPLDPDDLRIKIDAKFGRPLYVGTHPYV